MADMVTKQELEAAKIDVKHAGEVVNEKKVINPRYGQSFNSFPLELENLAKAIKIALAAGAGSAGWTDALIQMKNGESLREYVEDFEFKKLTTEKKALPQMLENFRKVDINIDAAIIVPVKLSSNTELKSSNHVVKQKSPATIVLESEYGATDIIIDGLSIEQDKSGPVSGGTGNNHASIKMRGARRARIKNLLLNGQLGISLGMGASSEAERRSMFNFVENILMLDTNMGWEQLGAAYNTANNLFMMSALARGVFIGDRMTGYDQIENPLETAHAPCHGNLATNVFIRNLATGISLQNSAKYNSKINYFITECDRAVQVIPGTVLGNNPTLNNIQFIAEKCGQLILNDGGNHNTFEFLADGSAFTDQGIQEIAGFTGKGFNKYLGTIKNSAKTAAQFRYSHNLYGLQVSAAIGNGVNINGSYGNGSITVSNASGTGVALNGNYNNLQIVATECLTALSIPGSGNIVNIQTDGNVTIPGEGNTIIGRIGGNLIVEGNNNKFIGEVVGVVTRTGTTGNNFTGLKGWSDTVYQAAALTTNSSGRLTIAVPKHASAQIRSINATIPSNPSKWTLKDISISGGNVLFELQDNSGNAVPGTSVAFNYAYSCS